MDGPQHFPSWCVEQYAPISGCHEQETHPFEAVEIGDGSDGVFFLLRRWAEGISSHPEQEFPGYLQTAFLEDEFVSRRFTHATNSLKNLRNYLTGNRKLVHTIVGAINSARSSRSLWRR
jgi:hypothetical protein